MSLATQLGLEQPHGGMPEVEGARWRQWQRTHPVLEDYDDLATLRTWVRSASSEEANDVLLALAELGAPDGGDDKVATMALVRLLLPGAVGVARALTPLSERIDELVGAQLWINARTVSWRKGVSVAATVLMSARREVMTDLGLSRERRAWRAEVPSENLEFLTSASRSATPVGTSFSLSTQATDIDLLHGLLQDAVEGGVVSRDDCDLLLRLADRAGTHRAGRGHGGLLARDSSAAVARELGLSRATVARRAVRALRALQETFAPSVRAA